MHIRFSSSMAKRPVPVIVWLNRVGSRRSVSRCENATACNDGRTESLGDVSSPHRVFGVLPLKGESHCESHQQKAWRTAG